MSSSGTDQPPAHDPQRDPSYTPTPPAPGPRSEAADERDAIHPQLGILVQKARGNELRKARELTSDGIYNYRYDNEGNTASQTNIA
jgi:hypothetical protein